MPQAAMHPHAMLLHVMHPHVTLPHVMHPHVTLPHVTLPHVMGRHKFWLNHLGERGDPRESPLLFSLDF